MKSDSDILLTTRQAADWLDVSVSTLERWRALGVGPRYTKKGRWVRYRLGDLRAFVESGLRGGPPGTA
jgi:predicted site-specific integrase-resolvase